MTPPASVLLAARPPTGPLRTLRSATCGRGKRIRSGSSPIGDRAPLQVPEAQRANQKSVTSARPSVTHVLNLKCYRCIDCTGPTPWDFPFRTRVPAA